MTELDDIKPKTEKEAVARWHDRIGTAKRYRDRISDEYGWERFLKEYKGKYGLTLGSRKGRIEVPPINQVFSFVQSDIAGMSFRDPYFCVNPQKRGTVEGAAILEGALNYYWRFLRCKEEQDLELLDADLVGHAWNKDGYFTLTEGDKDAARVVDEGMFSKRVSWRDVVFNIGSRMPPKDSLWMAHRIVKPLEEIKEKYPKLSKLEGSIHPHIGEADFQSVLFKDDARVGVLWEIHDATKRQIYLIAEGYDYFVKPAVPWPDYLKEFPFCMLWFYKISDEPYPMSPIGPWEPQILETNKLFAQALNHVKRWNRQAFIKAGMLSEETMDKFEEGVDGAILEVQGTGSMNDMIAFSDFGQLPPDIYNLLDRLAQIERETNGQPETSRGGTLKTMTRTLGELEAVMGGAKGRLDRRIDLYETHQENIARHLIAHMQANFHVEQIAKIVDETPEAIIQAFGPERYDTGTRTLRFSKDDIQGEYDVDVKVGSTLPLNKQVRFSILRDVLELAVKIQGPVPPFLKVIILELLHEYRMPALQDAFEVQEQQAAELAAQAQQSQDIEKAKTAAEAEKRKAQADQIDAETAIMEQQLTMAPDLMMEGMGQEEEVPAGPV